jgi:hypothetical protein
MGISNGSIKRAKKVLMEKDKDEKVQVKAAQEPQKPAEKEDKSFSILRKQNKDKDLEEYLY